MPTGNSFLYGDGPDMCQCTDPAHVANCADCLGFGVWRVAPDSNWPDGIRPRFARDAGTVDATIVPCPSCGTGAPVYPSSGKPANAAHVTLPVEAGRVDAEKD